MKQRHPDLKVEDLLEWAKSARMIYAYGSDVGRSIHAKLDGSFEVEVKGEVVLTSRDAKEIIDFYNEL